MKNIRSIIIIAIIGVLLTGCSQKVVKTDSTVVLEDSNCAAACARISASSSAPEITAADLQQGWYWGNLNQKKKGTPATWTHELEGTRSAAWKSPENASANKCDCIIKKD